MKPRDLTGLKFNKLTAIRNTGKKSKTGYYIWVFRCDCPNQTLIEIIGSAVSHGSTKSCGCLFKECKVKDITGQRFGRLLVNKIVGKLKSGHRLWECICDCGRISIVAGSALRTGNTQSCGCLNKEFLKSRTGILNPSFNPDLTLEDRLLTRTYPEYKEWRNQIFKNDNYTCQKCQKIGCRLNAHHIESYAKNKELRLDINNGITLCKKCHQNLHNLFGYITNKDNLEKFLSSQIPVN